MEAITTLVAVLATLIIGDLLVGAALQYEAPARVIEWLDSVVLGWGDDA